VKTRFSHGLVLVALAVLVAAIWGIFAWTAAQNSVAQPAVGQPQMASATILPTNTSTVMPLAPTLTPVPPTATALPPTVTPSPTSTFVPTPAYSGSPDAVATLEPEENWRLRLPHNYKPVRPPLFEGRLLVGLYGTCGGPGLGILGTASATDTVTMTLAQVGEYQALLTDTQVIPFFHMVTTIADPFPGKDKDYNHRAVTATLQLWLDVARRHDVWSVLDIQPAHSPITVELAHVEPFLRQKNVHLAIDPEFLMSETTRIPGQLIGFMDGETLNIVQSWLNDLAIRVGERKMLIIHQFDNRMFAGKEAIVDYPLVELVWDADGFGAPGAKIADYEQYAGEPGFEYGGFKLFYNYDEPVMTPENVLRLKPRPVFVVYQ
jgi:hypothetical protein